MTSSFCLMEGIEEKNWRASDIVISSTSAMFFPLYLISRVSLLYLFPLHISQGIYTGGRKCISTLISPSPRQDSHLPPDRLKLNLEGVYPLILESDTCENNSRINENAPVEVAGLDRGVFPRR